MDKLKQPLGNCTFYCSSLHNTVFNAKTTVYSYILAWAQK